LPGERAFVGRIGVVAGTLGTLAELALWVSAPGDVVAPGLFATVVAATVLVVVGCLATPFERLPQPVIQAPVGAGIVLCALACWNTGGATARSRSSTS
jgi:hypothetical protein